MIMTREFATISEIVAMKLPSIPTRFPMQERAEKNAWQRPEWEGKFWRNREASGGGIEYSYKLLPKPAQLVWVQRFLDCSDRPVDQAGNHRSAWARYHEAGENQKQAGLKNLRILETVQCLCDAGWKLDEAITSVQETETVSRPSILRWKRLTRGVPREHWLAYLTPGKRGAKSARAGCTDEAWAFIKTDWLRPEKPTISACYRRLCAASKEHGWTIPSEKTVSRWLNDLPAEVVVLAREGADKLKNLVPTQERDRTYFHALQAVNADGHKWDVMVEWPDGTVARPMMVAWQDLYSNMILSWRVDRSENTDAIQLALGDLVERYGIPSRAYLDNGRAFASKRMTGGTKTRFRFKVKDGDAAGVMTILGIEPRFVTPYSGQSKPIERAWRDLAGDLAKHPEFAGAYTGNNPINKPANYGERAIPLEKFLSVISAGIEEFNNRTGRRTGVCQGVKSYREVFEASLSQVAVRKPLPEQKHLWLRAAENVVASKRDGSFRFLGNRYWDEFLREHMGENIVVRFDPQALHAPMHVYSVAGEFLGDAPVIEKTGFDNTAAASEKKRAEKQLRKGAKMQLEAERKLTLPELAALLPERSEDGEKLIEQKVVSPFRPGSVVTKSQVAAPDFNNDSEDEDQTTASILNFMRKQSA